MYISSIRSARSIVEIQQVKMYTAVLEDNGEQMLGTVDVPVWLLEDDVLMVLKLKYPEFEKFVVYLPMKGYYGL